MKGKEDEEEEDGRCDGRRGGLEEEDTGCQGEEEETEGIEGRRNRRIAGRNES